MVPEKLWDRTSGLVCSPDSTGTARLVPDRLGPIWCDDIECCQNLHRIVCLCVKLVSNMWNILFYQCQGGVWPSEMPMDAANMYNFDLLLHRFAFSTDKCLIPVPYGPGSGPDRGPVLNWSSPDIAQGPDKDQWSSLWSLQKPLRTRLDQTAETLHIH
jgi:hypothetical protein